MVNKWRRKWLIHLKKEQGKWEKSFFLCDGPCEVDFVLFVCFDCLDFVLGKEWRKFLSERQKEWYILMKNIKKKNFCSYFIWVIFETIKEIKRNKTSSLVE